MLGQLWFKTACGGGVESTEPSLVSTVATSRRQNSNCKVSSSHTLIMQRRQKLAGFPWLPLPLKTRASAVNGQESNPPPRERSNCATTACRDLAHNQSKAFCGGGNTIGSVSREEMVECPTHTKTEQPLGLSLWVKRRRPFLCCAFKHPLQHVVPPDTTRRCPTSGGKQTSVQQKTPPPT